AVSEVVHSEEKSIYGCLLLKKVEYLLNALVHKRLGADLNRNRLLSCRRGRLLRGIPFSSGNGQTGNRGSQKLSSFHVFPPEGLSFCVSHRRCASVHKTARRILYPSGSSRPVGIRMQRR